MNEPSSLSDSELYRARDLGGATYLSAWVHLMTRKLGVDDSDLVSVNDMALSMLEPLNHAMQACWCSMMKDQPGMADAMGKFRRAVEALQNRGV